MKKLTIDRAWYVVEQAAECSDHPIEIDFNSGSIAEVLSYKEWCSCMPEGQCGSWCDNDSWTFFKLKDGRHVIAWEGSDSSGHG